jgi:hypothetical protein
MLKPAYQKLAEIYLEDHERAKVRETFEQYLKTFPESIEAQVALHTIGLTSPKRKTGANESINPDYRSVCDCFRAGDRGCKSD